MKLKSLFLALPLSLFAPTGCDDELSDQLEMIDAAQEPGEEPVDDLAVEDEDEAIDPDQVPDADEADDLAVETTHTNSWTCYYYDPIDKKWKTTTILTDLVAISWCESKGPGCTCWGTSTGFSQT